METTLKAAKAILSRLYEVCPQAFSYSCVDVGGGPGCIWIDAFKEIADDNVWANHKGALIDIRTPSKSVEMYIGKDLNNEVHFRDAYVHFEHFGRVSLVMCLEVAEHLPQTNAEAFVDYLAGFNSKYILFSAAYPGQSGEGHVNCQYPSYWANLFDSVGFLPYDIIRLEFWDHNEYDYIPYWYIQNTILYAHYSSHSLMSLRPTINLYELDIIHPVLLEKLIER